MFSPNASSKIHDSCICVLHEADSHFFISKKKIEYDISTSKRLQKETNKSYTTFPNDIAFAKLRTCACFSVTSVPKFANTAV